MKTRYRSTIGLLTAVLVIILLLPCLTAFDLPAAAYAAGGTDVAFDDTDVMDDLEGSVLNGVPFDIADYPYNPEGEPEMLGFVEYCYSEYENLRGNYGLYIYIYNPALLDIATGTGSNRIQMAVEYGDDGLPVSYNKFDLELCSVSKGVEANRFWKFRISDGGYFLNKVDTYERNYYVSGVELWVYGENLPREVNVKTIYKWTGFAEGYGNGAHLTCEAEEMEAIDLEVQHTSYITGMSALGNGHYNQIHTAYFAVPNYYFDNYGRLQKILAEWYEYKLKNMLVTRDRELYNLTKQHSGHGLGEYADGSALPGGLRIHYGLKETNHQYSRFWEADWAFNQTSRNYESGGINYIYNVGEEQHILPLVFYSELNDPYEIFEFLNKYFRTAGSVDSNELLEAVYGYSNKLGNGYIDPVDKQISKDLFYDYVDEGRIQGYQQREVDFEDTFELDSYDSNHDWWDKLKDFGIWGKPGDTGEDLTIQPIYDVVSADLEGGDDAISKRLYINEADVAAFKAYYDKHKDTHHIILFRFANTDYFSRAAGYQFDRNNDNKIVKDEKIDEGKSQAYVCSETVFFNFDIIQLTFNDDGEYRAFAVVSDPIDVVGGLKPPAEPEWPDKIENAAQTVKDFFLKVGEWFRTNWKWIVLAVGIVLGLIILALVVKLIVGLRGNKTSTTINLIDGSKSGSGKSSVKVKRKKKKGGGS